MSYRDWERGEGSPRARQPIAGWDDPREPLPADPYSVDPEPRRTSARRRALERGPRDAVDSYLPRWAVESGIAHPDGRGRHAAPDDGEGDDRPSSGSGWQGGYGRRAEPARGGLRAIGAAPEAEHTSEWTFDRPQEQGYVGSRRADPSDEPVSGAVPAARPRRSASRRPQVTWSGGEEPDDPEPERRTRRARRAAAESMPAVDPWSRTAEVEPEQTAAVDPWDASGVHAWQGSGADRSGAATRWDQGEHTGQWEGYADTGESTDGWEWDRGGRDVRSADSAGTDRGDWVGEDSGSGRWEGQRATRRDQAEAEGRSMGARRNRSEAERWYGTDPAPAAEPTTGEGWTWPEQPEEFWSGTRLAGDDPRWMDPPPSAPRSPAVAYTAPRPRASARPTAPVGRAGSAEPWSLRQRTEPAAGGVWGRRLEDDLLDPDPGGPLRPLVYTAACYLVPAVLVFLWLLTLDGQAPPGCVTDISGGGCDSPRAHALGSLLAGAPRFGLALVSSLVVAVVLRRVGTTWRSATVALAAAVVGGGLSTVMISAVTGQPIG
ncbi:hypothetical protein [Micromonospora siamensis]|uniref:Uncharacterized protein n=1 Tax=Micromonospora siamensis TaxID=299152 RepID=A0A1C5GUS1_9ACTN|nr:hypothetical protein [Micromonospora siamensis]SCG37500.1 hypothetical protein GA0074704_0533 [Micromonospora siamensis]